MTTKSQSQHSCEHPGRDGTVEHQFDWSTTAPSHAVIELVAIAANRDPSTMDPLYHTIDPEALNTLCTQGSPHIQFKYSGYYVEITPGQEVIVRAYD